MKRKVVIALILVVMLPLVSFKVYDYLGTNPYKEPPGLVANKFIWLTVTRIDDNFKKAVQDKKLNYDSLGPLLTLYGAMSENFSGMLGKDVYPVFDNGLYRTSVFCRSKYFEPRGERLVENSTIV